MADGFKPLLIRLVEGEAMTEAEAEEFFSACLRGEPSAAQIGAAVTALRMRGETVPELTACARAMRQSATVLAHPYDVVDTCGTGGDGLHTFNVSTAAAIVAAGAGLKIAKHGTRALSSRSGSSDVLLALGVNIEAGLEAQRRSLDLANICFLYAPAHHSAMRHVLPIRQELGFRTIFNLLGPLTSPAGAKRQVLGVADPTRLAPMAAVLGALGATHAWVVHGQGMDELTTTGPSDIAEWHDGRITMRTLDPVQLGLPRASLTDLQGGSPSENAAAIQALLKGAPGPYRDIVRLNAAAALFVGGAAPSVQAGLAQATLAIDEGAAAAALESLIRTTNTP